MAEAKKVFEHVIIGDTLIVVPHAEIGSFRYREVHLAVNDALKALDDPAILNLVIDFQNAEYASSVIIGALVRMARKATDDGGKAVMCNANGTMEQILSSMNLFKLWPCFNSRDEAIQALTD